MSKPFGHVWIGPLSSSYFFLILFSVVNEGGSDTASARKFLDAADACGDSMVFFNVFNFFEERNVKTRGNPNFPPSDQCEKFVKKFNDIFS